MSITITNLEVTQALDAIRNLLATRAGELEPKPTYWLGRAQGILARHEADALAPVRKNLISKHALKNEKGEVVSNELGRIVWKTPEDSDAFDAGYGPILAEPFDFPLEIWLDSFGDLKGLGLATLIMQVRPGGENATG